MKKVVIAAVSIVFLLWVIGSYMEDNTIKTDIVQKDVVTSKTDVDLYNSFYSDLMSKAGAVDAIYKPFGDALANNDIIGATKIALKIKHDIGSRWSKISSMEVPKLENKDAYKVLSEGKDSISHAYMYKAEIVSDFIKLTESNNLKQLAELSNVSDNVVPLMLKGMAQLTEAGNLLGVKNSSPKTKQ